MSSFSGALEVKEKPPTFLWNCHTNKNRKHKDSHVGGCNIFNANLCASLYNDEYMFVWRGKYTKKYIMSKLENKNRRESTLERDAMIHKLYRRIMDGLGEIGPYVSKAYIYDLIRKETKLSIRTISFVLNHVRIGK